MSRIAAARGLAIATVAYGALFYLLGDFLKPGYSSLSQYISELNATGTAHATLLSYAGFVPVGLLFAAFLLVAGPLAAAGGAHRGGWWLLWSQPVAFIGTALVPCDLGCPIGGSPAQSAHDLLSLVTYLMGAAGVFLLSWSESLRGKPLARSVLAFSAVAFVVLFGVMLDPGMAPVRGLLQRAADVLLALSLLTIAFRLLRTTLSSTHNNKREVP